MLPATKAIPKEMLPVVDKPPIQYVVKECVDAGIKTLYWLVVHKNSSAENHFDTSFELVTLKSESSASFLKKSKRFAPDVTSRASTQGVAMGWGTPYYARNR